MKTSVSNVNTLFLLDTGASISVIKENLISDFSFVNVHDKPSITGVGEGTVFAKGSLNLTIFLNKFELKHKFYIVPMILQFQEMVL